MTYQVIVIVTKITRVFIHSERLTKILSKRNEDLTRKRL